MPDRHTIVRLAGALGAVACALAPVRTDADTWRVGDRDQPWRLFPVSFQLNAGANFKPDYIWGGPHALEVVVDDDGDGQVDEDPVEVVDNDADGFFNEDPLDGIDNDRDGQIDEDGVDPQFDNDGDGLLNEDGRRTGGVIYDPALREDFAGAPFFRHRDAAEAAADPEGPGYGWGDDDKDIRFNEDDLDGVDNDHDGLVDEDPPGPDTPLASSWLLTAFAYTADDLSPQERAAIAFTWDADAGVFVGTAPGGDTFTATAVTRRFRPSDWLRPIRADSTRNLSLLAVDRFLSGEFSNVDPTDSQAWGATLTGTAHAGTAGHGQVADGNVFTARVVSQRSSSRFFRVHFMGLFHLDLIRMMPRPDFPDRTPTSFDIWYAGDKENHFRTRFVLGELRTSMVVRDPIIPRQIDQARPPVKVYRFGENEEFGPKKARILNFASNMPEGQTWELAEFQAFGHGYALDAAYVTEIIDVGTSRPRFRRYFDPDDPDRPIALETIKTLDDDGDGKVVGDELASVRLARQFDPEASGSPVTWGRARWYGEAEGEKANVQVRVRSGTSLDTRIYQRKVGRGVVSPFIGPSIVADWPEPGSRIDLTSYMQLPGLELAPVKNLPPNQLTDRDGIPGGWTPWSAPFDFQDGLVEPGTEGGGVLLPLPPLHRYIQFRFDFKSDEDSGIRLDYLEFDFDNPVVSRGVLAEIFPDTAAVLGVAEPYEYILKPVLATSDVGFNRVDIAVPSSEARLDSLLIDDLRWQRILPVAPAGTSGADSAAWVAARLRSRAWLDTVTIGAGLRFAAVTYFDSITQANRLGIRTRKLTAADFPRGQDREIEVALTTPVFRLLTGFDSWIWNDAAVGLQQPTQPGNASDRLPSDAVRVTVQNAASTISVRSVAPNPFTPNGDGINDEVRWAFDVFLLTARSDISVTIFDLNGRPLRRLDKPAVAGEVDVSWNGRDEAGDLVPPGVYLYQLKVNSDTDQSKERVGTLAVAY